MVEAIAALLLSALPMVPGSDPPRIATPGVRSGEVHWSKWLNQEAGQDPERAEWRLPSGRRVDLVVFAPGRVTVCEVEWAEPAKSVEGVRQAVAYRAEIARQLEGRVPEGTKFEACVLFLRGRRNREHENGVIDATAAWGREQNVRVGWVDVRDPEGAVDRSGDFLRLPEAPR